MPMVVPKHDHCDSIPLEEGSQRSHSISPDRSIEANKHRKDSLNTTEFGNLSMLFLLYFSQGIPAGLAGATIPTILKRFLPYGEVGMFTLTVYPHCLKLIWGPIVDFYWSGRVGRRLTWILPTQLLMGLAMVAIGVWTTFYFSEIERSAKTSQGLLYVLAWVLVSTLSAIQSCVTDGWGVRLLPSEKLHWVSSAHTLGSISGAFTAYSLFMFVYEPKLSVPDQAASALGNFVSHWGVFYLATGALLPLLKQEDAESKDVKRSIISAYQAIVSILRLRPIQRTVLVHLLARLAFEVNDGATDLKLLDKGFGNANLAMLVLIIMPFDLASAHLGGVFSKKYQPLRVWSVTYSIRLFSVVIAALVVALGPDGPPSSFYIFVVFIQRMFSVTSATVMFTTFLNFHLRVADPVVAGTYMTILATAQNMGGILPRIPAMKLIDLASKSTCQFPPDHYQPGEVPVQMSCNTLEEKAVCIQKGGQCHIFSDGYYIIGGVTLFLGSGIFLLYLRPTVRKLEKLPLTEWALRRSP